MYTISKEFHFSAAHRLEGHPKCGRLHGHNYRVLVTLKANELVTGMVMDFGDLKTLMKPTIDFVDHRYIASRENLVENCPYIFAGPDDHVANLEGFIERSTAEELAQWMCRVVYNNKPWNVKEVEVTIWETPSSKATYSIRRTE